MKNRKAGIIMKATIATLIAVAKANNNQIPANLLNELGYRNNKSTRKMLEKQGIRIIDNIKEKDPDKQLGKLNVQEAIFFALKARRGEEKSMRIMLKAFEPHIRIEAARMCQNHLQDIEDVEQAGRIGLTQAIKMFDENSNIIFAGYAIRIIRCYMLKEVNSIISSIHWNEQVQLEVLKLMKYAGENGIESWTGEDYNAAAKKFRMTSRKVRKYVAYFSLFNPYYIDGINEMDMDKVGEEGKKQADSYCGKEASTEDQVFHRHENEYVNKILDGLEQMDEALFRDYAGLNDDENRLNLSEICRKYGKSRYEAEKKILEIQSFLKKKIV